MDGSRPVATERQIVFGDAQSDAATEGRQPQWETYPLGSESKGKAHNPNGAARGSSKENFLIETMKI